MRKLLKATLKSLPPFRGYFAKREQYISTLISQLKQQDETIQNLRTRASSLEKSDEEIEAERNTTASENEALLAEVRRLATLWPPGHYYSPIVSVDQIQAKEDRFFSLPDAIPGVDLNESRQLGVLDDFAGFYKEMPFNSEKSGCRRYYFENEMYSYADAIVLYSMIRRLRPTRIVEIGSGFSSCVVLDTNELFFSRGIHCSFIEPYPDRLLGLLNRAEADSIDLIRSGLQEVGQEIFQELASGDILFVDSSHVLKTDSDVNHLFGRILPSLRTGVYVHFHDTFYPFEYPRAWIYEGRSWNEIYVLRSFLQYNSAYSIQYFADYIATFHRTRLESLMPLCLKNTGGNIWLRREVNGAEATGARNS